MRDHRYERGQTIGFWIFGVIISLALTFYVMNYTNTVRWHVRAQNAADTAAMAAIAADANIANQKTLAEYAVAVNEYRVRSIIQSMANAGNSVGGCNSAADDTGVDCDNAYDQEPAFYDKAVKKYADSVAFLKKVNSATPPPSAPDASGSPVPVPNAPAGSSAGAAFSLAESGTNCWDQGNYTHKVFDCAFGYAGDFSATGPNSAEYVDVVTCRKVVATANGIFNGPAQFVASGRAAATLRAIVEQGFRPGDPTKPDPGATNSSGTPPPYQPIESCPPATTTCGILAGWLATKPYVVDYSGLYINATFYVPEPTRPKGPLAIARACKTG